jgi:RNA polymerase sigma-70 factor (ECF subfamily)
MGQSLQTDLIGKDEKTWDEKIRGALENYWQDRESSFERLWDCFREPLYRYFWRWRCKEPFELTQEVLYRLLRALDDDKFRNSIHLSRWVWKVAHRLKLDYFHNKWTHMFPLPDHDTSNQNSDSDVLDQLIIEEAGHRTKEAIFRLPSHLREIIELRYDRDMSYKEIADELKIEVSTVRGRLVSARKALRKMLEDKRHVR